MGRILAAAPPTPTEEPRSTSTSPQPVVAAARHRVLVDLSLLATIVVASAAPHVGRIGFYSDDWALLASLEEVKGRPFGTVFEFMSRAHPLGRRPLQNAAQILLFRAFGQQPLGYQLTVVAALVLVAVFAYLVLSEAGAPRRVAFAVPAVYVLLPNYVAVRFWFATITYVLTFLAYLVSTYGEVRALRRPGQIRWRWKGVAWAGMVVAGLGIEIVLPLLAANLLIPPLWQRWRDRGSIKTPTRALVLAVAGNSVVLAGLAAFKFATFSDGPGGTLPSNARALIAGATVQVVDFGAALPHTTWWAAGFLDRWDVIAVVAVTAVVFARLISLDPAHADDRTSGRTSRLLAMAGALYFATAASLFLVSARASLTGTGNADRVWTAASFGWAMVITGAVGALASLFQAARARRLAWSGGVAVLCGVSLVVTLGLSHFWTDSYREQNRVLRSLTAALPSLDRGTTVILDGVCPYDGPAPVYAEPWDLSGRLVLEHGDPSLRANVLTTNSEVRRGRLVITTWGEPNTYTPGPRLTLYRYDDAGGTVRTLGDAHAVRQALARSATRTGCPVADGGAGEALLPFDRWLQERRSPAP